MESSYVFESDFKSRRDNAKGDAYNGSVGFGYRIPLGEGWPNMTCGTWNLRLGANYTRHDFDNSGGLPLPLRAACGERGAAPRMARSPAAGGA